MQQTSVAELPAELIARIFEKIDDRDRAQIIPLVSKRFAEIHKGYFPRHRVLVLDKPVTRATVTSFLRIASTLKELVIRFPNGSTRSPGCLPQLLAMAAVTAPRLQSLEIHHLWAGAYSPVLDSLAFLTQLRVLRLDTDFSAGDGHLAGLDCLSGLGLLEEAEIGLCPNSVTGKGATDMWDALGRLEKLRSLGLFLFTPHELSPDLDLQGNFLQHASCLTQIRELHIEDGHLCLDERGMIPEGIAALTQLTSIAFETGNVNDDCHYQGLPGNAIPPGLCLPCLQKLSLDFEEEGPASLGPLLHCSQLTSLSMRGGNAAVSVGQTLPLKAAFLPSLVDLSLCLAAFQDFPTRLAEELTSLAYLDLSHNQFERIPCAISHISRLQRLTMVVNPTLQLHPTDAETLAVLPRLRQVVLQLRIFDDAMLNPGAQSLQWSTASMNALSLIRSRLPGLAIEL